MKKIIVVGGGPAGLMAAVKASEQSETQVVLLEKMPEVGKKMRITGKGRCNITNGADLAEIIKNIPGNGKFLHSSLRAFDNRDVINFFEAAGLATKVERGGRVFPVSDKAIDVVNTMLDKLHEQRVDIRCNQRVIELLYEEKHITGVRLESGEIVRGDAVIIATGGKSYPKTGSTGDGYTFAQQAGHTVQRIFPALVPLEAEEEWVQDLQGLSLRNIKVKLIIEGKVCGEEFGEMMFTHFGVTGPVILTLSRNASANLLANRLVELEINLKPALTPETLTQRVLRDFAKYQNKQVKNAMVDLLPGRLIAPVLDAAYLDCEKTANQVSRAERLRLVEALQHLTLTITRTRPIAEAIVTAGGVSTKEIQARTMESRFMQGLYFAGEVMDIDGFTGGYNLQAAFSTGAAAGFWSTQKS